MAGGRSEMSFAKSTRACVCGWLIVAYTAGGKAPALSLVVSLLTVLYLTGSGCTKTGQLYPADKIGAFLTLIG